ncbi:helix-turn-helix domain-containing protein [Methanoculleus sp. Wushi-C6]|uniref:Helix-turn-helix domain-containing protein n=1 Tax=Methanoculleus caldifontis TaxID=2651577 RepID=A0ABU3WYP8_9EURY|nr:helix-turn-helix domain-containing protein [Methanoculleus sp. Wushi-C6]MDV2480925.1 helix-turn-helix domain-containing protein [Methanoculleus sp. Wushi-C6]
MKKDAVAYLNTRKKGDFAAYKSEVENYCKYRFQIAEIFHDHRANATPPEKRKGFSEMLDYCAANNCPDIIIHDLFGLARDMDAGLAALKTLNDQYTVYCVNNDFFGSRDDGQLRREAVDNFLAYMDQYRENARKAAPQVSQRAKKEDGRPIGRPRALNDGQIEALVTIRQGGTSISQICRMFDVSRSTVSKILADYPELKGEWKGARQEPGEGMPAEEPIE